MTDRIVGIYEIVHLASGRRYVGSSQHVKARLASHRYALNQNRHPIAALQNAWNADGLDAFALRLVEGVDDPTQLLVREQFYLSATACQFNTYRIAMKPPSQAGVSKSADHRRKIAEANRGKQHHVLNVRPVNAPESYATAAAKLRGRKLSNATRAKMHAAKAGRPLSPEHYARSVAAIRARCVGVPLSPETRAKIAAKRRAFEERRLVGA